MSQMGYNKTRVIGGKVLKYRATAPVSGSSRSRLANVGELKNIEYEYSTPVPAATSTAVLLNTNIAATGAGPSPNERIGRRMMMKSLWVRWNFTMAPTSTGASPFRILIVYDKQNNAAAQPTALTVLQTNELNGFKNLGNEKRFTTLMDEFIPAIGTGGPQSVCGQRFVKLNHEVEYSGASSADCTTGAVWVYVWQIGTIATAAVPFNFRTRIRYTD